MANGNAVDVEGRMSSPSTVTPTGAGILSAEIAQQHPADVSQNNQDYPNNLLLIISVAEPAP